MRLSALGRVPKLDELTDEQQERLADLLDQFLLAQERGERLDVTRVLTDHADLTDIFRAYLQSLGLLQKAAGWDEENKSLAPTLGSSVHTPNDSRRRMGDYELIREVGRGGMGVVYEARQLSLGRTVALKVLPFVASLDAKHLARFHRESMSAAQLHHPHIVPVYAVGCESETHFYSMQLIDGQSLDTAIRHRTSSEREYAARSTAPISRTLTSADFDSPSHDGQFQPLWPDVPSIGSHEYVRRVAELGVQAADALQHAHELGVIHRDVKPSNLLVDRSGKLWVTDFGLAHIQSEVSVTATGDVVGTWRYMSPEQAAGGKIPDPRVDVYSLGVTLYELLTLQRAFHGLERQQLLLQIERQEPVAIRKLNPSVSHDLQVVIQKAMAKDPQLRYSAAQELADDLRRFLANEPILAQAPTLLDRGVKWVSRHRQAAAGTVAALALALVIMSASAFVIARKNQVIQWQYREAREMVDQGLELADRLTYIDGAEAIASESLGRSLDYYRRFVDQAGNDPAMRSDLAAAHYRIGRIQERFAQWPEAKRSYESAYKMLRALPTSQFDRNQQTLAALALNNLGLLATRNGQFDMAQQHLSDSLGIIQPLVDESPDSAVMRKHLALIVGNLGHLATQANQRSQARTYLEQAAKQRERLLERDTHDIENQIDLATVYHNLSVLLADDDLASSDSACRQAIRLREAIVAARPKWTQPRADLALSYANLGTIQSRQRQFPDALATYEVAVTLGKSLCAERPGLRSLQMDLAISYNNLGQLHADRQAWPEAIEAFAEALALLEPLAQTQAEDPLTRSRFGGTLHNQAVAYERSGDLTKARQGFDQAHAELAATVRLAPNQKQYQDYLQLTEAGRNRLRSDDTQSSAPSSKEIP